jgi:hypothetical protein
VVDWLNGQRQAIEDLDESLAPLLQMESDDAGLRNELMLEPASHGARFFVGGMVTRFGVKTLRVNFVHDSQFAVLAGTSGEQVRAEGDAPTA